MLGAYPGWLKPPYSLAVVLISAQGGVAMVFLLPMAKIRGR